MKAGIFGAGSVGCYVGGMLAAAGDNVVLVGRDKMGERLADGVVASRFDGTRRDVAPDRFGFVTDPQALAGCYIILVTVKSPATDDAGETLARIAAPEAVIVSLQNGVSNASVLRARLVRRGVLAGMVGFNVAQIGANRFHCGTEGGIVLEDGRGSKPLADMLGRAGIATEIAPDIEAVQWGKLILNLNNAVNALSGLPLKRQLSERAYRRVLAASMREALAALKAAGIRPAKVGRVGPALIPAILDLPDWLFARLAGSMLKVDEDATSSMAEDLARGREPEIDWLNGEIIALGRKTGTPTPVNERIVTLVRAAFSGQGPRSHSGAELEKAVRA